MLPLNQPYSKPASLTSVGPSQIKDLIKKLLTADVDKRWLGFRKLILHPAFQKVKPPTDQDLLYTHILINNPHKRIRLTEPAEIRNHEWFSEMDFDAVAQRRVVPPHVPSIGCSLFVTRVFMGRFVKSTMCA